MVRDLKYVLKKRFDEAQKVYSLDVDPVAKEVIDKAKPTDMLALRIEPHSPPKIINAEIITLENISNYLKVA